MKGRMLVLLAVVALWLPTECRRNRDKNGQAALHDRDKNADGRKQSGRHSLEIANALSQSDKVDCHRAAVHWCGRSFAKVSKLLNFLSGDQAFQAKCALRKAFFACLDKIKEKPCKKYHKYHKDDNFRKKLADKLWATRVCVLGVKDAD